MAVIRKFSNFLVILLLAAAQSSSAQQDALGSILNAAAAQLNSGPVSAGTTVYNGAHFLTGTGGMVLVQAGAAQLSLGGTSAATLRRGENGVEASLETGSLAVSTTQANAVSIALGGATLQPLADVSSYARTSLVEPRVYLIQIQRGAWKFKYQCEEQTLHEGSSFRLYLDRAPVCASANNANGAEKGTKAAASGGYHPSNTVLLAVVAGGGAGIAYWGYREMTESPSAP